MHSKLNIKFWSRVLTILFIFFPITPAISADHNPKILLLNSYHKGFPWTDDIVSAIEDGIFAARPDATIDIEYLDTKTEGFSESYQNLLTRLYTFKFSDRRFDLIITTDDNALAFLRTHHASLFGNAPTIFAGVNNFDIAESIDRHLITGIFEKESERETIKVIQSLLPDTKQIFLIYDSTETGNLRYQSVQDILPEFPNITFKRIGDTGRFEDIAAFLSQGAPDSAAILASYYTDETGQYFELEDSTSALSKVSNIPLFTLHLQVLESGTIGGKLLGGEQHGRKAAEMALEILDGTSPEQLPLLGETLTEYHFDAKQLQRFGIDMDLVPPSSILHNKTPNFYETYGTLIYWWGGSLFFLGSISVYLLVLNENRRRAQRLFENLFNTIDIGILRIDVRTKNIVCNRRAESFLQLENIPPNKILDEIRSHKVYHHDGTICQPDERPINCALEYGREVSGALVGTMINENSKMRWFVISAFVQKKPKSDEIEYVFCTLHDVTKQREIEDHLRQVEKMEALGKVIAGVAHDFNNALAIVRTNLETLALTYEKDEEFVNDIGNCSFAVDRCSSLTERLLFFAHRKDVFHYRAEKTLDLNNCLRNADSFLRRSLTPEIELEITPCPEKLCVDVNLDELENALINLAVNARDAMNGKGRIEIKTNYITSAEDFENYAEITVSDSGSGISNEDLQRIFEPFYTTKPPNLGTGLGLSMVYGFVKRLQGQIHVDSEIGKGTRFVIRLPISKDGLCGEDSNSQEDELELGNGLILVVDDEDVLLKSTCRLIEKLGFQTLAAENFECARQLIETHPDIQLVLSDIVLSGAQSGIELLEYIREARPNLPVLLTSGNLIFHAKNIEINEFTATIPKPFRLVDLSQKIKELLNLAAV